MGGHIFVIMHQLFKQVQCHGNMFHTKYSVGAFMLCIKPITIKVGNQPLLFCNSTAEHFLDALASLDFTLVSKRVGRWVVVSNLK